MTRWPAAACACELLEVIGRAQATEGRERQHRRSQGELDLASPPFLDRCCHGDGTLALGGLDTSLNACQVGRHPLGYQARVARAVLAA